MADPDPYHLQSVNNTLDVMEALASGKRDMGVSEISEHISLSKSAVHRILANLVARGYAESTESGRYRLGIRFWQIGIRVAARWEVQDVAKPHLHNLLGYVDENVLLAVYDRGEVVYIDKAESDHDVQAYSPIGGRSPAYTVASGQALLAHQDPEEVNRVLASGLEPSTPNTIVDPERLRQVLDQVRERGYAVNIGQRRSDVNGVAAPVTDATDRVVAAISISGPAYRFGQERIDAAREPLLQVAKAVSSTLHYGLDASVGTEESSQLLTW